MKTFLQLAVALSLLWGPHAFAQSRVDRALQNYEQVLRGEKRMSDLTPQEQAAVAEIDRRVRARERDDRASSGRCVDAELRSRGTSPSHLARRTIALRCGVTEQAVEAEEGR